jgi:hypothetical protein
MEYFLERFFDASRAKWWQLLAAVGIGALFGLIGVDKSDASVSSVLPYVAGGALLGLFAGLFLLWVDAGQRCREFRGEVRLTMRERLLAGCIIVGFTLGGLSALCGIIMAVVRVVEWLRH